MYPCFSVPVGVVALKRIKLIKGSQLATPIRTMPLNVDTLITSRSRWFLMVFYGHEWGVGGTCFRSTST